MILCEAVFDNVSISALSMSHEIHSHIQSCVCGRWCVTKLCERWCVTKLCLTMPQMPRLPCMSQSATPATQEPAQCPKCHACHAKRRWMSPSHQVTHLPRKTEVDVAKCHACLPRKVARRPGRPKRAQARHQSQPSAPSATPATRNEGGCQQVPRLPRKTKVDVTCHAKRRWMSASATPATQNEGGSRQVPLLAPPEPAQCPKCHACHAKRR